MKYSAIILLLFLFSCGGTEKKLPVVENVDLQRYMGKWYEIGRFPNRFERGLQCVTATYSIREDGDVTVLNAGQNSEGKKSESEGQAWVPDPAQSGALKVQFFWPFKADYLILDLDDNYGAALVGSPDLDYLWILSRQQTISEGLKKRFLDRAQELGFEIGRMEWIKQDC
ncbi:MAG: lipocalin [Cryomorphaceae bacterium]|nr:lipocalin [Cryomorphaceae bacterium]